MTAYGSGDDPELALLERSRMPDEWRGREEPSPCGSFEAKWTPSSSVPRHTAAQCGLSHFVITAVPAGRSGLK